MSDDLDIEPSYIDDDDRGYAMAMIEQQRASIIERLRTTKAASVTLLDENGDGYHWGIFYREDMHPGAFLLDAAIKAVRDLAAASNASFEETCQGLSIFAEEEDGP